MIPITKPFLPPKEKYQVYIDQIWHRNWLTNDGPLVRELEDKVKSHLNLEHLLFVSSGTMALQLAIKVLDLEGEIITTPFSYVATTSSIVWQNCIPIFADIDSKRLTIDPNKIEELITPKTSAILATHIYGIPCHTEEIEAIAKKYNLKIIYDAAHAFGTKYRGKSLLDYGDISILSTHATKIFHTIEGGAVITKDPELNKHLTYLRNFGHDGAGNFNGIGINGKNSEFHAAMGLCNMQYVEDIIAKRKKDSLIYDELLNICNISRPLIPENTDYNYSYYPIILESEEITLQIIKELEENNIFPRRYFYPSLNQLDYINTKHKTPICDELSSRIICLPLYHELSIEEIGLICKLLLNSQDC